MALQQRAALYRKLEEKRKKPLIVYVTSARTGAEGAIAADAIAEIVAQLQAIPADANELDLYLVSNGGDGTVAWRIVSLIRERVKKFSVLVPQAAFSAATLIALGANEIVMHAYGNLGPTDPQIHNRNKNVQFGAQDLAAFLTFARQDVGLTDQAPLLELFKRFSEEVGFVGVGVAARSSQLSASMAEKLLRLHMTSENQAQKAKVISEALNTKFFHHGYPVSKSEAKDIGLPIAEGDAEVEALMWQIWRDIEADLQLRQPFSPVSVLYADAGCGGLFDPAQSPGAAFTAPPAKFLKIAGIVESHRVATRHAIHGTVIGTRGPDMKLNLSVMHVKEAWEDVEVPELTANEGAAVTSKAGKGPKKK